LWWAITGSGDGLRELVLVWLEGYPPHSWIQIQTNFLLLGGVLLGLVSPFIVTGDDIILIMVPFRKYICSVMMSLICRWCAVSCQYNSLNIGLVWELSNIINLRQYDKAKVTPYHAICGLVGGEESRGIAVPMCHVSTTWRWVVAVPMGRAILAGFVLRDFALMWLENLY